MTTDTRSDTGPAAYPADPSSPRWDGAFAVACGLAWIGLLLSGKGMAVVADASTSATGALTRFFEDQWLLGPELSQWLLLEMSGAGAEAMHQAGVSTAHVLTAAALYVYARPRTGRMVAFGFGVVFLSLGLMSDTTFVAPLLGVSGSVAAGTWALLILLGAPPIRLAWLASLLLLLAVVLSGIGLAFVAAAVAVLLPSPRRRYLPATAPAVVVFVGWLVAFGSSGPAVLPSVSGIIAATRDGMAYAIGQTTGLGPEVGLVLALLLTLSTLHTIVLSESMRLGVIGSLVGLITLGALVAAAAEPGAAQGWLRVTFLYPGAAFLAVALASWLAHRPLDVPGQRLRAGTVVALVSVVAVLGQP